MPRFSKEEISERRDKVWEMAVRGVPAPEIAKTLGVHRNTVNNDLKFLRNKHREAVKDTDVDTEIGDIVAKYDNIFLYAMQEYSEAEKENHKASFLEKAMAALHRKTAILVDTGVLPKAAQEITGNMVVQGVDVTKASLEELKSLRERMSAQLDESSTPINRLKESVN